MQYLHDISVVIAAVGDDGVARFRDVEGGAERSRAGEIESLWVWELPEVPRLPESVGRVPTALVFPPPGGSIVGYVCFPAHSAGKRALSESDLASGMRKGQYADPAMHRSDSVDFAFIISGKIDYALPSGETRTFGPTECVISAGVGHAWQNPYDEPCIYATIALGANGTVDKE